LDKFELELMQSILPKNWKWNNEAVLGGLSSPINHGEGEVLGQRYENNGGYLEWL